jgi:hypothetical protein
MLLKTVVGFLGFAAFASGATLVTDEATRLKVLFVFSERAREGDHWQGGMP